MKLTSIALAGFVALAAAAPGGVNEDGKPMSPDSPPKGSGFPPYPPPPPPHGKPPPPPPHHGKLPPPPPDHEKPPPPPENEKPPPPPPDHGKPPPPPSPPSGKCTPGTYSCTTKPQTGGPGWQVCNTSGQYEYGGDCPPNTVCKFFEPSKSPYCVPPNYNFP